jgi:isopentenyl-diphosphate delta-isomerase
VLVDENDQEKGTMDKMEAHRKGVLHRAFSIFIFDDSGKMLLQQRAPDKYHGAHLWTNACCSHPLPGEDIEDAARRRLEEELGFITPLKKIFSFVYRAEVENELVEHEYDHVFAGEFEGKILPDDKEVADVKYMEMDEIDRHITQNPEHFTSWFKIAFPKMKSWWSQRYK